MHLNGLFFPYIYLMYIIFEKVWGIFKYYEYLAKSSYQKFELLIIQNYSYF